MTKPLLRYGVIGLGFMGQIHVRAVQAAAAQGLPCVLAAVADPDANRRTGRPTASGNLESSADEANLFDPRTVKTFEAGEDLIRSGEVDLISICTRTDTHVAMTMAALGAGVHVLVEKPVALDSEAIRSLITARDGSLSLVMPAMCMRFWPGWEWLIEQIRDGRWGAPLSGTFRRLSASPTWSTEFYGNLTKSGGALFDLHIHDVDFITAAFGIPSAVRATGHLLHVTGCYEYEDGPSHVTAEGAWDMPEGFPFRMEYTVVMENAVAEYRSDREVPLVLRRKGSSAVEEITLPPRSGYEAEVAAFVTAVSDGTSPPVTLEDALATTELLEVESRDLAR